MSPDALTIRRLRAPDIASMRAVNALFGEVFEDLDSYAARPPDDDYLGRLLGRDSFIALAAWRGDEMVGALAPYELVKYERQRSEIYIYDLAVRAAFRRQGWRAR